MPLNITIAHPELQIALTTRLTGNAPHMAMITDLHDHVPDIVSESDFPFENFAAGQDTWADSFDTGFRRVMMQLDVWSRYHGRKEAQDIMASQIALINRQEAQIALPTLHLVSIRLDYADVLQDPDGLTWHGVTRYVALVQATN